MPGGATSTLRVARYVDVPSAEPVQRVVKHSGGRSAMKRLICAPLYSWRHRGAETSRLVQCSCAGEEAAHRAIGRARPAASRGGAPCLSGCGGPSDVDPKAHWTATIGQVCWPP